MILLSICHSPKALEIFI